MRTQPLPSFAPRQMDGAIPSRLAAFGSLRCPFSPLTNPNEVEAGQAAAAWARVRLSPTRAERQIAAGMERLTSGFYPTTDLKGLTWATKFLHWAFALDDLVDETALGRGPRAVARQFERFDELLMQGMPKQLSPLEVALCELLGEFRELVTPPQYRRFCIAMHAYFGAMLWEANNRAHNWIPDLLSFQLFRPAAGAVPPFWMLLEPLEGVAASEFEHLAGFEDAVELAGRIVCWYNDVLSYAKEHAAKDVHNLAIVLERHRSLSPAASFEAAVDVCNSDVERFTTITGALREEHSDVRLHRYLTLLESMMATTLFWTLESARYSNYSEDRVANANVA